MKLATVDEKSPANEAELLQRAKKGDWKASEKLFVDYLLESPAIRSLLRRAVSDPEQRKDLLHEIFLQLITSNSDFRGDSALSTYIYRVARITVFQSFRRENTLKRGKIYRIISPPLEKIEGSFRRNPEYLYSIKKFREIVRQMIAKLPEEFREPVRLRVIEERTYAEVCEATKGTLSTVYYRIQKGKQMLAKYMQPVQREMSSLF
jgi:RNA polymerase sigma-70 factor, ECF subfamily